MKRPVERETCVACGRHRDEVGRMSWTGKCTECGTAALRENIVGLVTHSGPAFHRWRQAVAASVGAQLADERGEHEG